MPPRHQTHCINGHERTTENTYLSTTNKRHCLTCARERDRANGKVPREEYLRLRVESGIKRRAAEDKEAEKVLPLLVALVRANWPLVSNEYTSKPFYRRHVDMYLSNVVLNWGFTRAARHHKSSTDWVKKVSRRIEAARDHPEIDEVFDVLEEKLRKVLDDAHE